MSEFDDEVEQRFVELRTEDRLEAAKEKQANEEARQLLEALAEDIDKRIGSRRLVIKVVPAGEVFDAFAKFIVEVRHRRTDDVLGHVLQRDFTLPPRFFDDGPPVEEPAPAPVGPRIAYFFEPTILYEDTELQGYACDTIEEIDPLQFDRAGFIDWLYNELVELTAAHEQTTRN